MHFAKDEDVFRAQYEVSILIFDSDEKQIGEKIWMEKIETKNYDESVSPKAANLSQKSFTLPAGRYSVHLQVRDEDTKKEYRAKRLVTVKNFSSGMVSASDIMLVKRIGLEGGKKIVYPNISGNVGELTDGFFLFFEVYNHTLAESAKFWIAIRTLKGDALFTDSLVQHLTAGKTSTFVKIGTSLLSTGDYVVDAAVVPLYGTETAVYSESAIVTSRFFVIRWRGSPVSLTELNEAINQLQYITEKSKIDEMKDAADEKKRALFQEFWKKKDPTPNTERNELMEEYYSRVEYANKHFSHYMDGWKSDMGMVYIIFGTPSNIERHPFEIDSKPYEVWTYYDQNREFVFIDATGFGDYRLQHPIWDIWQTRPR